MKRPSGTQLSFSNLDGARASVSSGDRLSISFERQEVVEDGEEKEIKEEKEEEEEKKMWKEWLKKKWEEDEKSEKVVQLWSPEKFRRDYITSDPSATCGPSGKVTGSEGHVSNNININDPSRAERLKEAEAEHDPDDYVSGVELGVACWTCGAVCADDGWYQHEWREGIVEQAPFCSSQCFLRSLDPTSSQT